MTVENGLRRTIQAGARVEGPEVWFFGGSTMWGTGTDDTNTIPSVFAQSTGLPSVNFGETAYISRLSLAMLTNAYIQRPDTGSQRLVAFYDGVNDIAYWCRHDSDLISTQRQSQILAAMVQMRAQAEAKWTFSRTFSQLSDLLTKLIARSPQPTSETSIDAQYLCDNSAETAGHVARRIVETWKTADALADGKGDRFVAILQPVASVGAPHLDHLTFPPLKQEILAQYPAVYPLIRAYATEAGISFIDLSHAYDGDDPLYIDFCHVSPQAHHQLVPRLNATLREQAVIPPTTGITSQQ